MPSAVKPDAPIDVMPQVMASAFTEELRYEAQINSYPDGSGDRVALSANPRRVFRLTQPLLGQQLFLLYRFYTLHIGKPFYFYAPRETVPPWSWDGTGAATAGRYTVVFDGPWSETTGIPRASGSFNLREVA